MCQWGMSHLTVMGGGQLKGQCQEHAGIIKVFHELFFMKPLKDVASGGNRECVNGFIVSKMN